MKKRRPVIAFVWDNFGPMHVDRCEAVAAAGFTVIGVELFGTSAIYEWVSQSSFQFKKITLFAQSNRRRSVATIAVRIWRRCKAEGATDIFPSHYDMRAIALAAFLLRLSGVRAYTMACSKFDDSPRHVLREIAKCLFMLPYRGALGAGARSEDYLRWLGIKSERIRLGYNTLSLARVRTDSGAERAPSGVPHADRHFTVIARLVDKKNLFVTLEAYAEYHSKAAGPPRKLRLCGSGPLEAPLRDKVADLGLQSEVVFEGFLQSPQVASVLATTLALLLLSSEEQFGNVVIEAQAMGVPVIVSDRCGARDHLVRSGYNGFVVEPDNPQGAAFFMELLAQDEALWRVFAERSAISAERSDSSAFASAVTSLVGAA